MRNVSCTILLYAEGYRSARTLQPYPTIHALPLVLSPKHRTDANYLEACRQKINIVEYDYVGGATDDEASELSAYVVELREKILDWLKKYHPRLLTPERSI